MKTVLFVGKDQPLWEDIRSKPKAFTEDWEATFSCSMAEALALAERQRFDAIVADVLIRDGSGVELLDVFLVKQPQAVRVVLCANSDLQSNLRCIGKPHHHLMVPCDVGRLLHTLNQELSDHTWSPGPGVRTLLGKMRWVPSPPNVYFQITLEMDSPNASVETIGEIIRQDPPTTAKLLQLANSAVFGLQLQVNEPGEAVAYLGLEATRSLVLLAHTFSEFEQLPRGEFSIEALWSHSVLVGQYARDIALLEQQSFSDAELAYSAGLLHDLGKLLYAANLPVPFAHAVELARKEGLSLNEAERRLLGASHAELGLACWLSGPCLRPSLKRSLFITSLPRHKTRISPLSRPCMPPTCWLSE